MDDVWLEGSMVVIFLDNLFFDFLRNCLFRFSVSVAMDESSFFFFLVGQNQTIELVF